MATLVNPHEQGTAHVHTRIWVVLTRIRSAKQALLATLASARNNPNGKDVAEYLTKILADMEGIGDSDMASLNLGASASDAVGRLSVQGWVSTHLVS